MAKQKTQSEPNKSNSKKKKKITSKKLLSGPNIVAMKSKPPRDNPFETIWTRRKFDIVGKKRKGEEKRIGLSRSRAIETRNNTLLKEYEQSGKSSVFLDKRIGEQNNELGEFDKAILRFQHQRQLKVIKKRKYNLSDGEEDEYGDGSFTGRDDFEDDMSPADEADGDETEKKSAILKQLSANNAQNPLESGLMERDENKQKSKKEVMEEIILKSKFFKAQKAKDKEENEQLMEELDQNFASLVQSKALLSLTQPGKICALKALLNKGDSKESVKEDELSASAKKEPTMQERPDAYDKLVKEMVLDMRARPSDRTKTPEEIAQEERERLEQLEEERQKRMLGMDDSSDEASDGDEDFNKVTSQKVRSISGDDLGDSFSLDEEVGHKKGWVDEILEREGRSIQDEDSASSEDSDGDGDEDENDQEDQSDEDSDALGKKMSLKDWEQSDDDTLNTDLEEEEDDSEGEEIEDNDTQKSEDYIRPKTKIQITDPSTVKKIKSSVKLPRTKQDALPFVIEVPKSPLELSNLLENRSDDEIIEAINRIRACNAIRLAAENRKKMQEFYGILLQYFAVLATKKPLKFKLLNLLVKPLVEMSIDTPFFAGICARHRLRRTRNQFCEDIKNPEKSCWPSLKTLFLLRLWSIIFPCTDFRHVVMTPAILLMCEYLMRCPITSGRDIAIGSFLCSMVLSIIRQSQKFCPEALIFLRTVLMSALKTGDNLPKHLQVSYFSEFKMLKPWLKLRDHVSEIHPLDFLTVIDMTEDSPLFSSDDFRASVLVSVIETLRGFVQTYEGFSSFPEIFLPISTLLRELLEQKNIPDLLQDKIKDVSHLIENKVDEHHLLRRPLQMRKHKLEPIKSLIPKFEENFVKGRDYDPDRVRAETKKLKRQLKREAKGAVSALKKDTSFLAVLKANAKAVDEAARAEKYGKAKAFLQEQENASKSGQLGKSRKGSKRARR